MLHPTELNLNTRPHNPQESSITLSKPFQLAIRHRTGVVSGIQWVPAEATQMLPAGAQPASVDFAEAWNRGNLSKEDQKNLRDWQRSEEKRRKKEEKESMKFLREKDRHGQGRYENDPDLRLARERDAISLQRRKSFNQDSAAFPGAYPSSGYAGSEGRTGFPGPNASPGMYPPANVPSPGMGYTRERTGGGPGLAEQFADLGLDHRDTGIPPGGLARPRKYSTHGAHEVADRARRLSGNFGERPSSMYDQGAGGYAAPGSTAGYTARPAGGVSYASSSPGLRSVEPPYPPGPRPSSPYGNSNYPPPAAQNAYPQGSSPYGTRAASPYHRASSPFNGPTASPYARSASPFGAGGAGGSGIYPPGHIMEGRPTVPGARSRATTPIPGMGPGVGYSNTQGMPPSMVPSLAAPECFSRPINAAHPYTPFETMKIQDMDVFLESLPRMPIVLQTHDVYTEDWTRLMDDTALAWSGRLPLPIPNLNGKPPKRATLAARLLELWNHSFFERRGVELVLYKGRERRSGPQYGLVDLPYDDYNDDTSSSSSSSSEGDDPQISAGFYGGGYPSSDMHGMPDRQRRHAAKSERRRRRKEKKLRRREREKRYSLWLFCLPQGAPGGAGAGSIYGGSASMSTPGYSTSVGSAGFGSHSPAMSGAGAFRGPSPGPGYNNGPAGAFRGPSPGPGYNINNGPAGAFQRTFAWPWV
ncbi:hypothetical protein BT96DRAFT_294677 [Gymnopus androsaceus JB14]|uniref:Uncharacterized protein n=1 Tax=Gymnopus androsaceus JB14 TaxID=1447944 RepID=A0A6A4IA82_9AGAR|nr:hypothetical protein BT96DRAFT_294677 [Gymnopus androsaceus JB14]